MWKKERKKKKKTRKKEKVDDDRDNKEDKARAHGVSLLQFDRFECRARPQTSANQPGVAEVSKLKRRGN